MYKFALLFILFFSGMQGASAQQQYLFIGTYTHTGSKGIYVYKFDSETGSLEWVSNTDSIPNPSFLTISKDKKFLYACTESRTPGAGSVSAFSINPLNGHLTFINKQPASGFNPAYVAVHESGRWVTTANYTSGSISVFPVREDGSLQPFLQDIRLQGTSINKERQEGSHVHATVFSPDYRYLFAPDLGTDKIMLYRFSEQQPAPLSPLPVPAVHSTPGSGPRHLTFHPNRKFAYVVEELSGTVTAYRYRSKRGTLLPLQRIATHPADSTGPFGSADIHISPDGRFLYASNRGRENNIAVFSINKKTGHLILKAIQPTLGVHPRNFTLDRSGKYLLVANMLSDKIVVFERDSKSGLMKPNGVTIDIPQPSCLLMTVL